MRDAWQGIVAEEESAGEVNSFGSARTFLSDIPVRGTLRTESSGELHGPRTCGCCCGQECPRAGRYLYQGLDPPVQATPVDQVHNVKPAREQAEEQAVVLPDTLSVHVGQSLEAFDSHESRRLAGGQSAGHHQAGPCRGRGQSRELVLEAVGELGQPNRLPRMDFGRVHELLLARLGGGSRGCRGGLLPKALNLSLGGFQLPAQMVPLFMPLLQKPLERFNASP